MQLSRAVLVAVAVTVAVAVAADADFVAASVADG
jgi:hypothetical protein